MAYSTNKVKQLSIRNVVFTTYLCKFVFTDIIVSLLSLYLMIMIMIIYFHKVCSCIYSIGFHTDCRKKYYMVQKFSGGGKVWQI